MFVVFAEFERSNLNDERLVRARKLNHIKMFEQPLIAVAIASQKINMTEAGLIISGMAGS